MLEDGEPIRLIIWDLDETFWRGTLTEGGVREYVEAHHRLIIDLARRGIMSSICSRNRLDDVREILAARGLWDYFIFPSVDWSAKPARVRAIVETAQLRPQTVLFIDDNPANRAAVAAEIAGLRVVPETFIAEIADHPLFKGKPDPDLTRLKRYKLLETRAAEARSAADPKDFLRASEIRVEIEVDLEPHWERIVELINRTNQLNFTKWRLSDDVPTAVAQLKDWMKREAPWVRAGLVRVRDKYGDYGYCGFYAQQVHTLRHFCFSCRILGFGVESWLYRKLGRPEIVIVGETLVDLHTAPRVDWITMARFGEIEPKAQQADAPGAALSLRARCEAGLLRQYLRFSAFDLRMEGAHNAGLMELFSDSAVNMFYTSGPRWRSAQRELPALGFPDYGGCRTFEPRTRREAMLFFAHREFVRRCALYRHKSLDFAVCLALRDFHEDLIVAPFDALVDHIRAREPDPKRASAAQAALSHLREHYAAVENPRPWVERALRGLLSEAPDDARLLPVLMHPQLRHEGEICRHNEIDDARAALIATLSKDPRVTFIDASACINSPDEIIDGHHYDRIVYYRMVCAVIDICRDPG